MPLIDPGKRAPAFTLQDQTGTKHKLTDHKGAPVVLFFYPKDDTSGCTAEACAFRDLTSEFKSLGVTLFGISPQDTKSKAKFASKHSLTYPILADEGSKVCAKYGVWQEKSMYGNKYMGVVRTTYLIRPSSTVEKRWDKVKVTNHAQEVLSAAQEITSKAEPEGQPSISFSP